MSAGNYKSFNSNNILNCTESCCNSRTCNVALLYNKTCYMINCFSSAGCLPVKRNQSSLDFEMVLVRSVSSFLQNNKIKLDYNHLM